LTYMPGLPECCCPKGTGIFKKARHLPLEKGEP